MASPGTLANQLPPGPDFIPRKLADLERAQREGFASIAQSFQGTVQSLADTVAHLNSLTTTSVAGANINSGPVAGDSTFHWIDDAPPLSLTLTAATGHLLLTLGCGQTTLSPGEASAVAAISITGSGPDGWSWPLDQFDARLFSTNNNQIGTPLIVSAPIAVPSDGPVTFTVKLGVWSSSTTTFASAQFSSPYIIGQVIN